MKNIPQERNDSWVTDSFVENSAQYLKSRLVPDRDWKVDRTNTLDLIRIYFSLLVQEYIKSSSKYDPRTTFSNNSEYPRLSAELCTPEIVDRICDRAISLVEA